MLCAGLGRCAEVLSESTALSVRNNSLSHLLSALCTWCIVFTQMSRVVLTITPWGSQRRKRRLKEVKILHKVP